MTAGWALCWEIWARQRWLARALVGYLLLMAVLARTLPDQVARDVLTALLFPLPFAMLVVIAGGCRGLDGRLETPGSMFPGRLLVLPVSARALVGWSLLGGAVPVGLLWPLCAVTILWPRGVPAPLVWPSLVLFNVIAWLQALCWIPFGVPYLRIWVIGLGLPCLIFVTTGLGTESGLSEPILCGLLAGLGLAACGVALAGVGLARQGVGAGGLPRQHTAAPSPLAPFPSPHQALLWREWRVYRWWFCLVSAFSVVFGLPLLYMTSKALQDAPLIEVLKLTPLVEAVGPGWLTLVQLAWIPFVYGMVGSAEAGRAQPGTPEQMGFLLVHPVSTGALVAAKLHVWARAVLLGGFVLLVVAAAWVFPTGHWIDMSDRLVAWSGSRLLAVLVLAAGWLLLVALLWGHLAAGLWVGLSGRRWLERLAVTVGMTLLGVVIVLIGVSTKHPEVRQLLERLLPLVLTGLLALKVGLAAFVCREVRRRGLVTPRVVLVAAGAWLLAAGGWFALLAWVIPAEVIGRAYLAATVVLAVPIARIGLAPLALAWNRHR